MAHVVDAGVMQGRESRYYTDLGRASDYVLRCKDCKSIVLITEIKQRGCCTCGNKRFAEIVTLNDAEQMQVLEMDFPHKAAFLAEFSASE